MGFPRGSVVKNLPANAGDVDLIPGSGRPPGEGNDNLLQYSCLESSMDKGTWLAMVQRVAKSWTQLSYWAYMHAYSIYMYSSLTSGHVSVQFSSVAQLCLTLCDPMNCSTPGLLVHHHLPESTQTHVHWVRDAIQPSHPLSSPSAPAPNPSQHQSLFQWVNSSHEVAKVLEFQL